MHRHIAYLAPQEAAFYAKCIFAKLSDALSRRYINSSFVTFIHSENHQTRKQARQAGALTPIKTIIQGLGFTAGQ